MKIKRKMSQTERELRQVQQKLLETQDTLAESMETNDKLQSGLLTTQVLVAELIEGGN